MLLPKLKIDWLKLCCNNYFFIMKFSGIYDLAPHNQVFETTPNYTLVVNTIVSVT